MTATLKFLAASSLGISAGAILTGGVVLVPCWRSLAPADFLSWFGANAQRLLSFYGPLQLVSMLLAIAAFGASLLALRES